MIDSRSISSILGRISSRQLRAYTDGLERFGYRHSPLEKMAYDAEADFSASVTFDAEKLVSNALATTSS